MDEASIDKCSDDKKKNNGIKFQYEAHVKRITRNKIKCNEQYKHTETTYNKENQVRQEEEGGTE